MAIWEAPLKRWRECLSFYSTAISLYESEVISKKKKKKNPDENSRLSSLEKFVFTDLAVAAKSRIVPWVNVIEYRKLIEWKLTRGKWRPSLKKYADELSDLKVRFNSQVAISELAAGRLEKALKKLTDLKGCGPASASAVLAAIDPNVPFMSDQLLEAIPIFGGKREYKLSTYMTMEEEVRKKVEELGRNEWNARKVEQAVFVNAIVEKHDFQDKMYEFLQQQSNGNANDNDQPPLPQIDDDGDDDDTVSPPCSIIPPSETKKAEVSENEDMEIADTPTTTTVSSPSKKRKKSPDAHDEPSRRKSARLASNHVSE